MRGTWTVVTLPKHLRRFEHNLSPPSPIQVLAIRGSTSTKGIEFVEVNIRENEAARAYVVEDLGYTEAPVVVITDEDHWSGFRPDHIDRIASNR